MDLILDFIGAPYFERNINALAFGGRLVQIGIMGGVENAKMPLDRLLYRHLHRFRERWLAQFVNDGLSPVIDSVYPLAEAGAAQQRMEDGLNVGKIVLSI